MAGGGDMGGARTMSQGMQSTAMQNPRLFGMGASSSYYRQPTAPAIDLPPITQTASNYPNQFNRMQEEQAYTQAFRPGPTGQPFNPNPTPAPTTGPQGQALTTRNGQQGYFRQTTADEIRQAGRSMLYGGVAAPQNYDSRTRQVFVPYSPQATQTTQSQQFFQPIYLSRYQNYQPEGYQGPFGGQMNPYGGFNPFMGFGGMGGMYGFAKGGKVVHKESNQESGIAGLLK